MSVAAAHDAGRNVACVDTRTGMQHHRPRFTPAGTKRINLCSRSEVHCTYQRNALAARRCSSHKRNDINGSVDRCVVPIRLPGRLGNAYTVISTSHGCEQPVVDFHLGLVELGSGGFLGRSSQRANEQTLSSMIDIALTSWDQSRCCDAKVACWGEGMNSNVP